MAIFGVSLETGDKNAAEATLRAESLSLFAQRPEVERKWRNATEEERVLINKQWEDYLNSPKVIALSDTIVKTVVNMFNTINPTHGIALPYTEHGIARYYNWTPIQRIACRISTSYSGSYIDFYYCLSIDFNIKEGPRSDIECSFYIDPEIILTPGFDFAMHLRNIQ